MRLTGKDILDFVLRHRNLFLFFAGLVALFILLNYILLPIYVNHGGTRIVPRVTGLALAEAGHTLDSAGLQPVQAETKADSRLPVGTVVAQNPLADAVVKPGRRVYLTVSGGEALVAVPDLRGRSVREAKFALERYGLRVGASSYSSSDTFPENTVIGQSVAADSRVPKGESVSIVVSTGKTAQEIKAPEVVGRTVTEAEKILTSLGLKVGNITYQPNFELVPNTVVDQYPRPGEPVGTGQAVDLFVVKVGRPSEEIQPPKH